MGPYLFANSALTGFFLFGAIYHFILWSRARHNRTLLFFSLVTLLSAVQCVVMVAIVTAETSATGQSALDLRSSVAVATVICVVWLLANVTGFRPRTFLWTFTLVFGGVLVYGLFEPFAGVVTGVERVVTPWGELITVLRRDAISALVEPIYVCALSAPAFGVIGGLKLTARDRVGGVLTIITSLGLLISIVIAFAIDSRLLALPYLGPILTSIWVLPIAWQLARTNQRQAEQLVATERRFRAIFDQTFQFMGLLDVNGTLLEANRTALDFAGIRTEDVIGRPFWETPWWTHSPALQEKLRHAIQAASRGEVARFEATHPRRDGQMCYFDVSVKPVYDAAGNVILLIPEGRDITNRVISEDAKRRLEQQLLQAQKMEAVGQLAGGVAHDFNNLLMVIAGHTDMLLEKNEQASRHDLEQIRQASERAASMTRQLLALGRQSVLDPKVLNLNAVVAQTESMLRRSIGEGIDLIVRASADVYPVKADSHQLSRVLLNLAINARDAMPDGGTLVIETRNIDLSADVTTSILANADSTTYVLLSMSDTGHGMTAETKARLFEPFYTTKGHGQRYWPRSACRRWDRQAVRWTHRGGQRARRWHDVPRIPAGGRRARRHGDDRSPRGGRRMETRRCCSSKTSRPCVR